VTTSFTSSRASTTTGAPEQDSHQAQHELLIATTNAEQRAFLAAQLDADGHTVYEANSTTAAVAKLSGHAVDGRATASRPGRGRRPEGEARRGRRAAGSGPVGRRREAPPLRT
jgi:hypothetical protein